MRTVLASALAMTLPVAAAADVYRSESLQAEMTRNSIAMQAKSGASLPAEQVHVAVTRLDGRPVAGSTLRGMVPFAEAAACRGRPVMVSLVLGAANGAGLYEVLCARGK